LPECGVDLRKLGEDSPCSGFGLSLEGIDLVEENLVLEKREEFKFPLKTGLP